MDILDKQLKEIDISLLVKRFQTEIPDLKGSQIQAIRSILSEECSFPEKFKKGEILSAHSLNKLIQFFFKYSKDLEDRIKHIENIVMNSSNHSKNKNYKIPLY